MELAGYGRLIECPYNKMHQLHPGRIQTHLVKCRKEYPLAKKVQCPFNVTHLINEQELAFHVADCADKAAFDRYRYTSVSASQAARGQVAGSNCGGSGTAAAGGGRRAEPVAVGADYSCLDSEENWDDMNEPTYDPQEYVRNAPVIRTLNLAAPSQRAAFRDTEIVRLNRLSSQQRK